MEIKEGNNSLSDALSIARVPELPEELKNNENNWIKAIVLVRKCNLNVNYALAINDGYGNPVITNDFGSPAKIVRVEKIYPYYFLTSGNIPDLRSKVEIIRYLSNYGYSEEEITQLLSTKNSDGKDKTDEEKKNDREQVKKFVNRVAILSELRNINELTESRRMNDGYENKKRSTGW